MSTFSKWALAIVLFTGISSCLPPYPSSDELYQDQFVIVNRDTLADFTSYATYAVPDTLYYYNEDSILEFYDLEYSDQVIAAINDNMQARGYTKVNRDEDPDLVIMLTVLSSTTLVYYPGSWWGYWDCYYWYYYCGGWYYPSYPSIAGTYTSGSLIVEVADLQNGGSEDDPGIPLIWNSLIYALTENSQQINTNKAIEGINTAFEMATYLTAN